MYEKSVHPFIPNSVPEIKEEMLREIEAKDAEELYAEMIPDRLRFRRTMNLPKPLVSEYELKRHVKMILSKNKKAEGFLNFAGAGCWQHYVPAVCDVIASRSEFLTAYAGEQYSDLGKYQALFEFQSMVGELVGFDVVGIPTYDWAASAANAIRMASRITSRGEVLLPRVISPDRLSVIRNFCQPPDMPSHIDVKMIDYDEETGTLDLEDLKDKISSKTAAIYFENPTYLGMIEDQCKEISEIAHDKGAQSIAGVDPISLGVLSPPAEYGADIACGEVQPLGIHLYCGGGLSGFMATRDEEKYVAEYPSVLISIADTAIDGEYGFGYSTFERTSYGLRDKAKDYTGTSSALWNIVAGVYLALMGPQGMRDIGETIIQKSHYAANLLSKIDGVSIPFSAFFKEFVVNFDRTDRTVGQINKSLLNHEIFGGKDVSKEFPELGSSALYCITEIHSIEDIRKLANALEMILK